MQAAPSSSETRAGFTAAAAANAMWGVLPAYLKFVGFAGPFEILAERVLFSIPAAILAILVVSGFAKGWREMAGAMRPGMLGTLSVSAVLIFFNWTWYVWAVANHHVMEAALAYFLAPLAQVVVGVMFFRERLRGAQKVALSLAAVGVLLQAVALGAPPWISLAMCASWVCYAFVRKRAPVPAATGMLIETLMIAPFAICILIWLSGRGGLAFGESPANALSLALTGPATALPLILFAFAARRVSFAALGLLQYIAPSLQFAIGIVSGEPLSPLRIISFVVIWLGLVAFSWDTLAQYRAQKAAAQIEA